MLTELQVQSAEVLGKRRGIDPAVLRFIQKRPTISSYSPNLGFDYYQAIMGFALCRLRQFWVRIRSWKSNLRGQSIKTQMEDA